MKRYASLMALLAAAVLLVPSCRPRTPVLGPVPERIVEIEGFASLRYERGGASNRVRLAFILAPPGRGRLDVLGPIGRLIFNVVVEEPEAVLLVPSKKACWQASREEVLAAGLGFPLDIAEIGRLLSGRWKETSGSPGDPAGWTLERDASGRVRGGGREGFVFRVEEFFPAAEIPRRFSFSGSDGSGMLSILSLAFNRAGAEAALGIAIPSSYSRLSRAEMERLLRDED